MNIEFRYMYRDCGNWKNDGSVIFGNKYGMPREDIERDVKGVIGTDQLVDAEILKLPTLYFREFPYDPELDHPMHEFIGLSETSDSIDDLEGRDIIELLASMRGIPKQ